MLRIQIGLILLAVAISVALVAAAPQPTEAPIGLDNLTNGLMDQTTHDADSAQFAEIEGVAFGIGPVFNDVSCGNCHADAGVMGTATQNKELRVGYFR